MPDIIMDAAYNSRDAVVILDHSEVRLIMKALDVLRYSEESAHMNGSQLVNLAGLSAEWRTATQDIGARPQRLSTDEEIESFTSLFVGTMYGKDYSWEVY